ncbi:MAG: hypothetical protein KBONHNOK_01605 [Candidatus Methanoperedenaceae archaeon GB50]|nr:MAG: hypothetical protein KBONHNOK_01605 [Candidatus Methanoperedenaceae archaeon GB50]
MKRGMIVAGMLLMFSALTVSAQALSIDAPEYAVVGETLSVTVASDGDVIEGADVYFVLNGGTPTHARTDEDGVAVYKPLLAGTLGITARYEGLTAEKTLSVEEVKAKEVKAKGTSPPNEGGSSGASGVSSDEPSSNIVMREIRDQYLYADRDVTYSFTSGVPVYELAVRATSNTGLISAQVELLKDLSGRVSGPPDGVVDEYINIWLGKGDFGSQSVKEAVIRFRVSKDWISEHGVDSVLLMQYSDGGWVELETARIGESGGDLLYESSTDHLSSRFAIVGTAEETASTEESMPVSEEDLVETTPERATEGEEGVGFPIPGFGAIFSLIGLLATVFLLRGRL